MIFLAITSIGLADAMRTAKPGDDVWCGSDAISEDDYAALPSPKPSRFIYSLIGPDSAETIEGAIATIEEHHPGHTVWVERVPTE